MPAETRTCPVCWTPFTAGPRGGRRIYCSKKCRGTAWERRGRRQARPTTTTNGARPSPAPQPVATTGCPHCGKPITIVALLATPQTARPRQPDTIPIRQIQPT